MLVARDSFVWRCLYLYPVQLEEKIYKTRQTFEKLSESEIREHCGVPAWGARDLIELYDQLEGQISTAVPVDTKVLVFLSQLRSGSFQRIVGGVCGVSRSTVSRIIEECANFTLNSFAKTSINFPTSVAGINKIKQDYYEVAHLPNIVGVVDADSGYAAESKLLVPFRDTTTVPQQQQFNRALKKTRSGVERTIGNWKCRFRSMDKTGGYSCYRPSKVCKLIVSSVALHNICVTHQIPILEEDEYYRDFAIIPNLQDHPQVPPPQGPFNSTAATTRDEIAASLQSHVVPEKTGRRPNFSEDELVALATAVKDRDNIITGQFKGAKISKTTKNKAWAEVTVAVNAVGGKSRTLSEIQTKHKNLRTSTKKIESENKREILKTGGGKSTLKSLSESQLIILEMLPSTLLNGIPGGIDLHDPSFILPTVPEPTSRDEDSMDLLHEYETHDVPQSLVTQEQPTGPDLVLAAAAVADGSLLKGTPRFHH
ncbi:putative nuclease HARBI1 [Folsomia candida]|uniref:Regulatory protein zeste n=1 Tax=Folsomia candida TaxID=158441 RepID=A0A226D8L0_FOLCA|nr:putative nuclease HARBI1 [Folsomia candida]